MNGYMEDTHLPSSTEATHRWLHRFSHSSAPRTETVLTVPILAILVVVVVVMLVIVVRHAAAAVRHERRLSVGIRVVVIGHGERWMERGMEKENEEDGMEAARVWTVSL